MRASRARRARKGVHDSATRDSRLATRDSRLATHFPLLAYKT